MKGVQIHVTASNMHLNFSFLQNTSFLVLTILRQKVNKMHICEAVLSTVIESQTGHFPFHSLQSTLFSNRPTCNLLFLAKMLVRSTYSSAFWQTEVEQAFMDLFRSQFYHESH